LIHEHNIIIITGKPIIIVEIDDSTGAVKETRLGKHDDDVDDDDDRDSNVLLIIWNFPNLLCMTM